MGKHKSGRKGGSGKAHDRPIAPVADTDRLEKSVSEAPNTTHLQPAVRERIFAFCENGIVLTVMGIVGSLAGVFVAGRFFLLLSIPLLLGLHRSAALKGLSKGKKAFGYGAMLAISLPPLWLLGIGVDRSREHIPTVEEISRTVARTVIDELPKPDWPKPGLDTISDHDALQVLNFDSLSGYITVQNHSKNDPVTIIGVVYSTDEGSQSSSEAEEVPPEKIAQFYVGNDSLKGVTFDIVPPLSSTWQGQIEESQKEYRGCIQSFLFWPSGPTLQQVIDHFVKFNLGVLPTGNGTGTVIYTIRQSRNRINFPLKVLIAKRRDCGSPII